MERLPHKSLNIIDVYISIYFSIINSPKGLHMNNQANELCLFYVIQILTVLGQRKTKKKSMESEEYRKIKSERKKMRYDDEML